MKVNEAFKNYSLKAQQYHKKFAESLVGRKIVDLDYGSDAEGDPQLQYFILDNGAKIGIARVYLKTGKVEEENRQKVYRDKKGNYILRVQFLNWPIRRSK